MKRLNPNTQLTFTRKEINQMKKREYMKGQQEALNRINLFPLLALRDEFGFGRKRMMQYMNKYLNIVEAYNEGYLSFHDIVNVMEKEVKIDVKEWLDD